MVITLVTLAGSRGAWASFSKSTCPSSVMSTAEGAARVTAAGCPSSALQGTAIMTKTNTAASHLFIKTPSKQVFVRIFMPVAPELLQFALYSVKIETGDL